MDDLTEDALINCLEANTSSMKQKVVEYLPLFKVSACVLRICVFVLPSKLVLQPIVVLQCGRIHNLTKFLRIITCEIP